MISSLMRIRLLLSSQMRSETWNKKKQHKKKIRNPREVFPLFDFNQLQHQTNRWSLRGGERWRPTCHNINPFNWQHFTFQYSLSFFMLHWFSMLYGFLHLNFFSRRRRSEKISHLRFGKPKSGEYRYLKTTNGLRVIWMSCSYCLFASSSNIEVAAIFA